MQMYSLFRRGLPLFLTLGIVLTIVLGFCLPTIILPSVLAAIIAVTVTIAYGHHRLEQQKAGLILTFATELVIAFERCVMYFEQAYILGEVSKSPIPQTTDASTLSALANVVDDPEIIINIVELRARYFHIGRHAEDAAKFATESDRIPMTVKEAKKILDSPIAREPPQTEKRDMAKKKIELSNSAMNSQLTALAFFERAPVYDDIIEKTEKTLDTARQIKSGKTVDVLKARFERSKVNLERYFLKKEKKRLSLKQ